MAFIGKASDVPKPTGKAHFRQGQFSDHLIVGQAGIMPSSAHSGVEEPYRPHVHPHAQARRTTLTMGGEERQSAKRHINPHFTSLSDDAKRAEGRLGKASVVVTDQQQRCQAFYAAGGQKSIVKQPPGQEANLCLTSYNYTPMEEQGGTATHARSNDAFTTSVQYSEARLRKIQKMHPEHRDVAAAALREYHGEPAIVPREEKISRQIAVEAFAKGSDERMAAIAATNKYAKCGYGLGESAEWLKRTVPYALDNSAPRPDTATGSRAHVHPDNNRSHFIIGATMEEMHTDPNNNNPVAAPAPRLQPPAARTHFNVNAGQDYPPPPQVGVSTSLWKRPALLHYDAKHHNAHSFGEDDADSMAMKRARGGAQMRSASYRHEPPLNLFSGPPQPQTARGGPTTLRAQCEGRWRRQEDVAMERRTGRARTPQSYKKTALW